MWKPAVLACDTAEEQRGANISSAELVATFRANEKGWVKVSVLKIKILHTMERLINISLVISVLTFLMSQ